MTATLTIVGASLPRGPSTLRVSYSRPPLAANAADPAHALWAGAYSLVGPGQVSVTEVATVDGDPRSFDASLSAPLAPGTWTVTVDGVAAPDGARAGSPTSATVTVAGAGARQVNPGGASPGLEAEIYRAASPAIAGPNARALVASFAAAMTLTSRAAQSARDQGSLRTAAGRYLSAIGSASGVDRPGGVGLGDELYRALIPVVGSGKSGRLTLLSVLEILYGQESVRSLSDAGGAEPFDLADGDDLLVLDGAGPAFEVTFRTADFTAIGEATSVEVAASIDRQLRRGGSPARAVPHLDPITGAARVRLVAGALGLGSRISVTGGRAQRALLFPSVLPTSETGGGGIDPGDSWSISRTSPATAELSVIGSSVNLSVVHPGDVAVAYGAPISAPNRGSWTVTAVDVRYAGSALVQRVSLGLPRAQPQSFTAVAVNDVLFLRPRPAPARGAVVSQAAAGQSVTVPATGRAVERGAGTAAYLHSSAPLTATSARALPAGLELTFASPHGLSDGDLVQVDGFRPSPTAPAVNAGNGTSTLDATLATSLPSATAASAAYPAISRGGEAGLLTGDAYVVGGVDGTSAVSARAGRARVTGSTTLADGSVQYSYAFVPTASLSAARYDCSATVLTGAARHGKVLVAGGVDDAAPITSTELYDPVANSYSPGPSLGAERYAHAAAQLSSGRVILVGGVSGSVSAATTDVYDPVAGTLSAGPPLLAPRSRCRVVQLRDGRTLAVGGVDYGGAGLAVPLAAPLGLTIFGDSDGEVLSTCEVFDGASWAPTGRMSFARVHHRLEVLPDGSVLAIGGFGYPAGLPGAAGPLGECEVWDPRTGRWHRAPSMRLPRILHVSAQVAGRVIVAGGEQGVELAVEAFDPATRSWSTSPAAAATGRSGGSLVPAGPTLAWAGGYDSVAGPDPVSEVVHFLVPASDVTARGGLSGTGAAAVTSPTEISVALEPGGFASSTAEVTVTSAAAPADFAVPGPYAFDPAAGVSIAGPSATLAVGVSAGRRGGILLVGGAAEFPDERGLFALDFGGAGQVSVPYLRRLSAGQLLLDPSFAFPRDVPGGSRIDLLLGAAPLDPNSVRGSFWATDTPALRSAATSAIERLRATGVQLSVRVTYPGDRGLGNEGAPESGSPKLSDAVSVWAGDDRDAQVAALRRAT